MSALPIEQARAHGDDAIALAPGGGTSLASRIEAEIRAGRVELPVLPEAAARIREITARDGGAREIVTVIEREQSLAAAILRYANSVAYAGLREITDLQQAVTRLGLATVEQTVLALSAKGAFAAKDRVDEEIYRQLWTHSVTTAFAARRLAPRTPGLNSETVFLAGLLHDIGKVVVLRCIGALRRRDPERFSFERSTVLEFFDGLHCKVGDHLCRAWNLPAEIREVARRHHEPNLGPADALIAVIQLASQVAAKLGASLHPDPDISLLGTQGAAILRLDDVRVATLLVDVEDDVSRMHDVF
jgi:putative nucleotidyltransferase with HDIG domain